MKVHENKRSVFFVFCVVTHISAILCADMAHASDIVLRYFPSGSIYEYRWKLLEVALQHTVNNGESFRLEPFREEVTQNRGISLLQTGIIDVVALGSNEEREAALRPIRIPILSGIVGFRLLIVRRADQQRIAAMDGETLRKQLVFGLNSQWADLEIMRSNGYTVVTSANYENLFAMLSAGRFDAFPRGLNEADRELAERQAQYPELSVEKTKALYFPFPIYFWVAKDNAALAQRIESGLQAALADGSFRKLFESYHAAEIAKLSSEQRQIIRMNNPILPLGVTEPDTAWWWPEAQIR